MKGTISKIFDRQAKGKTFYSFRINGDDKYYGTGMKRPPAEGTYVEFEAAENERGYWDAKNVRVVEQATAPQKLTGDVKTHLSKEEYWDRKELRDLDVQKRIELQSCRNSAIEFVKVLLSVEGAFPSLTKAKAAEKEAVLFELVSKYTTEFVALNNNENNEQVESNVSKNIAPSRKTESDVSDIQAAGPDEGDGWEA